MNWMIPIAIWVVLLAVVLAMGAYRMSVARHFDHTVHLLEDEKRIGEHLHEEKTLEGVDFWGKLLTVLVIVYGLALLAAYAYHVWVTSVQLR